MRQQVFRFDERHDYLPDNFLVSGSNNAAYEAATTLTAKPYALNIHGPASSGKTHLAHIATNAANGKIVHVVEDVSATTDEVWLLHLLNSAREKNEFVFLTSAAPVAGIGFKLPDLTSRLSAINSVGIEQPDDALIYMIYARLFAARQVKVGDDVINYIAARSPRNFAEIKEIADKLDKLALSAKKSISISLAKQVVG